MEQSDEDLKRCFKDYYRYSKEALKNNVRLMDDIVHKVIEQHQKIIEQNTEILNQCQYMKSQLSEFDTRLEELKSVLFEESQQSVPDDVQPGPSTDIEFIGVFPQNNDDNDQQRLRSEDANLSTVFESIYVENKPIENFPLAQPNNVRAETSSDDEEVVEGIRYSKLIYDLTKNQRKLEKLMELLFRSTQVENAESHNQRWIEETARLTSDVKEVGFHLECFRVDPEEIECNEDLKKQFDELRLYMSEIDAEVKKMVDERSNVAASLDRDESVTSTSDENKNCDVMEEPAIAAGPSRTCDSNNNAHSREGRMVQVVENVEGGEVRSSACGNAKPIIVIKRVTSMGCKKEKVEAQVQKAESLPARSSKTRSSSKLLRSGRVFDTRTDSLAEKKILIGKRQHSKSLDKSKPIKKTEKIEPEAGKSATSSSKSDLDKKTSLRSSTQIKNVVSSPEIKARRTDRFYCYQCGRMFTWSVDLWRHNFKQHPTHKKAYECENCPKSFELRQELHRHEQEVHMTGKLHECKQCHQLFGSKKILNAHIQRKHKFVNDKK